MECAELALSSIAAFLIGLASPAMKSRQNVRQSKRMLRAGNADEKREQGLSSVEHPTCCGQVQCWVDKGRGGGREGLKRGKGTERRRR